MGVITESGNNTHTYNKPTTIGDRPKRRYIEADRVKALTVLDLNRGDLTKTALDTGIPRKTLEYWDKGGTSEDVARIRRESKEDLAELCQDAAYEFIAQARATVDHSKGTQAATGAAIFIDKMRALRGDDAININVNVNVLAVIDKEIRTLIDAKRGNPEGYDVIDRANVIEKAQEYCQLVGQEYDESELTCLALLEDETQ